MNVGQPFLTTAELAARPDFQLGEVVISPSARTAKGPGGTADVEPRVMQVLVVLADAAGSVVTRETLFGRCWGGVHVGDDSLNRAVGAVRKIAHEVGRNSFVIETIPRTGYRLTVESGTDVHPEPARAVPGGVSRRTLIATGLGAVGAAGGLELWSHQSSKDREFEVLMDRSEQAFDYGDPANNPAEMLRRAVTIRPGDATAHGLFAYARALRSDDVGGGQALQEAARAADDALAIHPKEPNARLAQVLVQRSMLDFAATEDRLRAILADDPSNIRVMRQLWQVLTSVGRLRDAMAVVDRAIERKPLAAANQYPKAQLLWILGRTAEADRVIDRAMQYWPSHRFVRFARFTILSFTERPRAALAMLDSKETAPQQYSRAAIELWRISLKAIEDRSPPRVAEARRANVEAAKRDPGLSNQAIMALSALGEIDSAFEVANALFAVRGPFSANRQHPTSSRAWRFTPWLFVPPTRPLRTDTRFIRICDEIGLTDYWKKRGIVPDYQLGLV